MRFFNNIRDYLAVAKKDDKILFCNSLQYQDAKGVQKKSTHTYLGYNPTNQTILVRPYGSKTTGTLSGRYFPSTAIALLDDEDYKSLKATGICTIFQVPLLMTLDPQDNPNEAHYF